MSQCRGYTKLSKVSSRSRISLNLEKKNQFDIWSRDSHTETGVKEKTCIKELTPTDKLKLVRVLGI